MTRNRKSSVSWYHPIFSVPGLGNPVRINDQFGKHALRNPLVTYRGYINTRFPKPTGLSPRSKILFWNEMRCKTQFCFRLRAQTKFGHEKK